MINVSVISVQQELYFKLVRVRTAISNSLRSESFEAFFDFDENAKPNAAQMTAWVNEAKQIAVDDFVNEFSDEGNHYDLSDTETFEIKPPTSEDIKDCMKSVGTISPEGVIKRYAVTMDENCKCNVCADECAECESIQNGTEAAGIFLKDLLKEYLTPEQMKEVQARVDSEIERLKIDFNKSMEVVIENTAIPALDLSEAKEEPVVEPKKTKTRKKKEPAVVAGDATSATVQPEPVEVVAAPVEPVVHIEPATAVPEGAAEEAKVTIEPVIYDRMNGTHTKHLTAVLEELRPNWYQETVVNEKLRAAVKNWSTINSGVMYIFGDEKVNREFKDTLARFVKATFK